MHEKSLSPNRISVPIDRRRCLLGLGSMFATSPGITSLGNTGAAFGQEPVGDVSSSLYLKDDIDNAVESGVDYLVKVQRADGAI
ncbi:MAG: hypothetical protein WBD31_04915, partial [Rubripirellula sp.]